MIVGTAETNNIFSLLVKMHNFSKNPSVVFMVRIIAQKYDKRMTEK
jgi:hypothetical protein